MPRGHKKNGAIPESEEDGTKGGSLSSDVSIFFKEIEGSGGNGHGPSAQAQNGNGGNAPVPADDRVTALETEAIQMFIAVARLLGYPRSVGEIFGILFAAEKPLTFEGISRKRGISAGSVSVGLRHLRSLGVGSRHPGGGRSPGLLYCE